MNTQKSNNSCCKSNVNVPSVYNNQSTTSLVNKAVQGVKTLISNKDKPENPPKDTQRNNNSCCM